MNSLGSAVFAALPGALVDYSFDEHVLSTVSPRTAVAVAVAGALADATDPAFV